MIKNALQYIVGLRKPEIIEVGGESYCDKRLEHVSFNPKASSLTLTTLTSLVDYITSDVDKMSEKMLVHVVSPTEVRLYSNLDKERIREELIRVKADIPSFPFDKYLESEKFIIGIQSKFLPTDDSKLILKFAGTVEDGTVAQYSDDGVTQKAVIKQGPASKADAIVPNPVTLQPYRTFAEVEQPETEFVFRMQSDSGTVYCALFEADGGSWRNEAMKNIKEYLQEHLSEYPQFTVIS